eukprot:scaffold35411_cov56-Phaeocystis_antarctica.AAC.4
MLAIDPGVSIHSSKRLLLVQLDNFQLKKGSRLAADRRARAPARGHLSESSACALAPRQRDALERDHRLHVHGAQAVEDGSLVTELQRQ